MKYFTKSFLYYQQGSRSLKIIENSKSISFLNTDAFTQANQILNHEEFNNYQEKKYEYESINVQIVLKSSL